MTDDLVQRLNDRKGALAQAMGITITEASPGRVVATMPVAGNTQPYGLLHGGASAALAETVGSIAGALHAGPDRVVVGVELNCTHHRGARDGNVTATAGAIHEGGTVATYGITIVNDEGALVCTARLTCLVRQQRV
jgi:1,4-dihydroxy-2-naphthoyl-CoA hydrolase